MLRDWLTGYKGREGTDDPYIPDYRSIVESILGRFILEHGEDLELQAGGIDSVCVVPSTERQPPHPLEEILDNLQLDTPICRILRRGEGQLGFRQPSTDAYEVQSGTETPQRILLIDDVYTTGSRLNSAATALRNANHIVVGALVIARRVNLGYAEAAKTMWDQQTGTPFDWATSPVVTNQDDRPHA